MPSTPEPAVTRARTPPTPLHGPQYDNYQPYSPRRSTRTTALSNPYSSRNIDQTTPPPTVKRARFARQPTQLSSPPSSPASPVHSRRQGQDLHKTPRKSAVSKLTNGSGTLSDSDPTHSSLAPSTIEPTAMLPTPSKTPRKRNPAALNATARILSFQPADPNDVMPSPRKQRKAARHHSTNGFDLYDEEREQARDTVQVYTDVNARVPELDENEDNPFVGRKKSGPSRPQRRSKRTPTEEEVAMQAAAERDEGMLYVFRGRKVFRHFSEPDAERSSSVGTDPGETSAQRTLKRQAGATAQRPLTRSALKPRILFPSEDQIRERERGPDDVDEEAATDIEMSESRPAPQIHFLTAGEASSAQTPSKAKPVTPPTTKRVTRSKHIDVSPVRPTPVVEEDEILPNSVSTDESFSSITQTRKTRRSPFDSWQRTKAGKKRVNDELIEGEGAKSAGKRSKPTVDQGEA